MSRLLAKTGLQQRWFETFPTVVLCLLLFAGKGVAGDLTVHLGPPSIGNGGNNPLSIPPVNPIDYEFTYITDGGFETNLGISPGLLFGKRSEFSSGLYGAIGAGLVLDFNGTGPGVYTSVGGNFGGDNSRFKFNVEFKQALAVAGGRLISPYAFRLGLTMNLW